MAQWLKMYHTQIDNSYLESPNGLTDAEFRVIMAIERLTTGFHRRSYKIPYSLLTEMTGIKNVSLICKSLKAKGWIDFQSESGKASVITILKPIKSVNRLPNNALNSVNDTNSVSEQHPLTQLNGSQGAKENFRENFKESVLTIDKSLIEKMKVKYPDKDIDQAKSSFNNYPHHQGKSWSEVEVAQRFEKWVVNQNPSHKMFVAQFKLDGGGVNYVGYCAECRVSDFYEGNTLMGDSRCCNAKILPAKPT